MSANSSFRGGPKAEPGIQGNRHVVDAGFQIADIASIRINKQWRICWKEDGPEDVEIVDYHD